MGLRPTQRDENLLGFRRSGHGRTRLPRRTGKIVIQAFAGQMLC